MAEPEVTTLLDLDPADLDAWLPVLERGGRVLLADLPGTLGLVREAVACGVLALVPDGATAEQVQDAAATLAGNRPGTDDVAALLVVLRDRSRRGAGARPDPRTAPRVLLLAFGRGELERLHAAASRVQTWGATAWTVVSAAPARTAPERVPTCGPVVRVEDPGSTWWPARAERLLVLLPRVVVAVLRRGTRLLAARAPGPARPVVARAVPAVEVLDRRSRTVTTRMHEQGWAAVMRRVRPALVARRVVPLLPTVVGDPGELDLVCAPGTDSRAVEWRLLREHPSVQELPSAGGPADAAVAAVVVARTRALAAALGGADSVAGHEGVA